MENPDTNPSSESDELRSVDHALLLAAARTRRQAIPLDAGQEQLLIDWVDGRLSKDEAGRAENLTRTNSFAAERVLERRLVAAAEAGPPVPPALTARVLKMAQPPAPKPQGFLGFRWPMLSSLQWSAAGAAMAAAIVAGVLGLFTGQENTPSVQRVQLAMVTLDDRRPGFGSQMRSLNSDGRTPSAAYQDIDIPVDVLRRAIADAEAAELGSVATQILAYLPPGRGTSKLTQVAIDSALATHLSGDWNGRMIAPVRAYNLDEPGLRATREKLNARPGTILLTAR
jgi:hypothetical protein